MKNRGRRRQRQLEIAERRRRARGYNPNRPPLPPPRRTDQEIDHLTVYFDVETMQEIEDGIL